METLRDSKSGIGRRKVIAFVSHTSQTGNVFDYAATYAQERRSCTLRFVVENQVSLPNDFANCDGIFAEVYKQETIDSLKTTGLPVVVTTINDNPGISYVDFSPEMTGTMAAEWFLRRQFTNFAFCGISGYRIYERMGGAFSAAVRNAGYDCITCDYEKMALDAILSNKVSVPAYLDEWIPTLPRRTAVFCMHDWRAALVIDSCMRLGRAVPDDIAVMGQPNDISMCEGSQRTITSINQNVRQQTYTALQLLEEMIDHPERAKENKHIIIPPLGVVERESTNVYPVDPPWLAKALSLIDDNLDRQITLKDLAGGAGVSESALQKAFRDKIGTSVNKYILSVKMREAKRLIDHGGYSVKELAARTGFSSQSYFTRAYTAYYGRPPSADSGR